MPDGLHITASVGMPLNPPRSTQEGFEDGAWALEMLA